MTAIRATISGPTVLHDIDPRLLFATQPFVIRHHARFYAEANDYWHAGHTSADVLSLLNRYPTLEPAAGGFVIRSGHHRCLVALLHGTPVRARIIGAVAEGPRSLTPLLAVGTNGTTDAAAAVAAIRDRQAVTVSSESVGSAVLDALMLTDRPKSIRTGGSVRV
ncbi:MAG: hypothetical protein ACOYOQ_16065 [Microthrixaceae bacterium]